MASKSLISKGAQLSTSNSNVRQTILATASELFYRDGVHSVGVDTIIAEAGVAKSSLYRHFRTKDELIAAYVQSEDDSFWQRWDTVASQHPDSPRDAMMAVLTWVGTKISSPGFRGCPQLNVAVEFPDVTHPARLVAANHKIELRRRLGDLARDLGAKNADVVADQLWLLVDGAFVNYDLLADRDSVALLINAAQAILPVVDEPSRAGATPKPTTKPNSNRPTSRRAGGRGAQTGSSAAEVRS
jgi:AcrR family transcriptional regulator